MAGYWGQLVAKAWLESDCQVDNPAVCQECCKDNAGMQIADCDCAAWTAECENTVNSNTKVRSAAPRHAVFMCLQTWNCTRARSDPTLPHRRLTDRMVCVAHVPRCGALKAFVRCLCVLLPLTRRCARVQATAQAWIDTKVEEPVSSCTTTVKEKVKGVAQKAKGKEGRPWRYMNRGSYIVRERTTTQQPVRFAPPPLCTCVTLAAFSSGDVCLHLQRHARGHRAMPKLRT